MPQLSTGKTVADLLSDWEVLGNLRTVSIRGLNELQVGLGQRVSRTKKVVCQEEGANYCSGWTFHGLDSADVDMAPAKMPRKQTPKIQHPRCWRWRTA